MTDTQQVEEVVDTVALSASLGSLLQAAREAKGLSQQDVSDRLRYSVKQVDALECNAFDLLPDAMITRGFIRSYARLLEIDAVPLLDLYRESSPVQSPSLLAVSSSMQPVQLTKDNRPWLLYILGSILVLLFLVAWFVYIEYVPQQTKVPDEATPQLNEPVGEQTVEPQDTIEVATPEAPLPETALPEAALPAAERQFADDVVPSQDAVLTNTPVANVQSQPITSQAVEPVPPVVPTATPVKTELKSKPELPSAATMKKVSMSVTQKSWVRVSDKAGQILYEATLQAGDTQSLSFQTPFNVVIGNAKATTVNVSGQPMDLTSYTRSNVARISLE